MRFPPETRRRWFDCSSIRRTDPDNHQLGGWNTGTGRKTDAGRLERPGAGSCCAVAGLPGLSFRQHRLAWYSRIPPVSFRIHDEVTKGRAFLDFSIWNEYNDGQRRGFTTAIGVAVGSGLMPLPQYLWIHRGARLSRTELELIEVWARTNCKTKTAYIGKQK
jgi:hypothetical protein